MRVGHLTLFCYYLPDHNELADAKGTEPRNLMGSGRIRSGNLKNMFFVKEK
jgi:hypothetical protein